MRTVIVILLVVVAAFTAGFADSFLANRAPAPQLHGDTDFDTRFSSRLLESPAPENFDLVVRVPAAKAVSGDVAVRLYSDAFAGDNNYIAVEVDSRGVKVLIVEAGVCRQLAAGELKQGESAGKLPEEIRLRRRPPQLEVVCDGCSVVRTATAGFPGGRVGVGSTRGLVVAGPYLQRVGNIVLTDDFMRGVGEPSDWRIRGKTRWEVRSLDNPGRSSNAFIYQAWGEEGGVSIIGRPYWDAYTVAVSVMGDAGGEIGIVVAASDTGAKESLPDRLCLVRWRSAVIAGKKNDLQGKGRPGSDKGGGKGAGSMSAQGCLEILQIIDGRERILATKSGGYIPGQWYRLGATLEHGRVTAVIDGRKVLVADSPYFSGGLAGLYARSRKPTEFDDFRLASLQGVGARDIAGIAWRFASGAWRAADGALRCRGADCGAFAVTGTYSWDNLALSARVAFAGSHPVGLVAAFRDPGNYLAYELAPSGKTARIVLVRQGVCKVLAREDYAVRQGEFDLSMRIDRGYVAAGKLSAFVPDLACGQVGVMVGPSAAGKERPASFAAFRATSIEHPLSVVSINEIFDDERLMKVWSGTAGDWKGVRHSRGEYERAFWHRALFYDDAEIEAFLPEKRAAAWKVALSLAKPFSSRKKNNGYVLVTEKSGDALRLTLIRDGQEKTKKDVGGKLTPLRLRFRKAGPFLLGFINDILEFKWRDPEPMIGRKIAWAAKGIAVEPDAVQIYSRSLLDYSFNKAISDWRRAGGVWQVTNRWQCDPRWSFMAGMPPATARDRAEQYKVKLMADARWKVQSLYHQINELPDPNSKLAALWHKQNISGDFMIECFVGPMHRFGKNYRYLAKNFCITVCGDGKDLATGYNCIFGGWKNTKSAILRKGIVVEQAPVQIPVRAYGNIHRMWFRLRVERRGDTIHFSAYTQPRAGPPHNMDEKCLLYLEFKDPKPLAGKRVAIWTYDTGMQVARCRIAAMNLEAMESPFVRYPAESPCIYTADKPEKLKAEK